MNNELVKPRISIYGCGDVGTRLLTKLLEVQPLDDIVTIVLGLKICEQNRLFWL